MIYTSLSQELHSSKKRQLEKEDPKVQRLAWLCQMKKAMLPGKTRDEFNAKRDEQVQIIRQDGSISDIYALAGKYDFLNELVTS
jgi:hypothetical protein